MINFNNHTSVASFSLGTNLIKELELLLNHHSLKDPARVAPSAKLRSATSLLLHRKGL
jgi:hypothetical protein